LGQALLSMAGQASEAGGSEADLSGFADRWPATLVFVVGGDGADPGLKPCVVVVVAHDGELGA